MRNLFKLDEIFIILFLIVFPFGQIIRVGIIQPIDIVVGLGTMYSILARQSKPNFFKYINDFLIIAGFSWILSLFIFHTSNVFYGLLYYFRLAAYSYFLIYVYNFVRVWNFAKNEGGSQKLLLDSLLALSIVSAFTGWVQYFAFPDLKPFFVWGWDMHLFRLVGTFLDPTFLGLIIVFGLILSIHRCIDSLNWKNVLITIFLLISLAFTYSRASYLAFFAAMGAMAFYKKVFKQLLILCLLLLAMAFLLPTTKNHSIELFRSFSAIARIENYQSTFNIFSKSPLFGVGFDNMCLAFNKYIGIQDFSSHACSGSDSSLLFILSTTGVVGLTALVFSLQRLAISLKRTPNFYILASSFFALLVHSLFSNSMFYPWITTWMMILIAVSS